MSKESSEKNMDKVVGKVHIQVCHNNLNLLLQKPKKRGELTKYFQKNVDD